MIFAAMWWQRPSRSSCVMECEDITGLISDLIIEGPYREKRVIQAEQDRDDAACKGGGY